MHYAVVYSFAPSITGARKTNARLHRSCICTNPELSQFTGQWCPFSTTFGLGLQLFQFLKIYIVRNLFYTVRRTSRRVEVSNFSLSRKLEISNLKQRKIEINRFKKKFHRVFFLRSFIRVRTSKENRIEVREEEASWTEQRVENRGNGPYSDRFGPAQVYARWRLRKSNETRAGESAWRVYKYTRTIPLPRNRRASGTAQRDTIVEESIRRP